MLGQQLCPLIRKIIAANSLNRAIQSLSYSTRQRYRQHVLAFPELSVNPRAVDKAKTVQYHLKRSFREVREVLLWQDVVNNSISPHRSNKFKHLTPLKLIGILKGMSCRLKFSYCTQEGAEDIFETLNKSGVSTLQVVIDLLSRVQRFRVVHRKASSELKISAIVNRKLARLLYLISIKFCRLIYLS